MAISAAPTPTTLADNPKSRLYRATQSGTYAVNIPVGVYEVKRQATTNIIIGSTTITPSTGSTIVFINEPQTEITFNSTFPVNYVPWQPVATLNDPDGLLFLPNYIFYAKDEETYFLQARRTANYWTSTNARTWNRFTNAGSVGTSTLDSYAMTEKGYAGYLQTFLSPGTTTSNFGRFSTDLYSWTLTAALGGTSHGVYGAAFGQGKYIGAGYDVNNNGWIAWTSGVLTSTWPNRFTLITGEYFFTAVHGDNLFLLGASRGTIMASTDLVTWTRREPFFSGNAIYKIEYINGYYIAGGQNGNLSVSTNGAVWERKNPGLGLVGITNITYDTNENLYVVANEGTSIAVSTDLNTWVTKSMPGNARWNGLKYINGEFLSIIATSNTQVVVHAVPSLTQEIPTSTFADTYIILEYKGKQKQLI
jgi:hypothetical protein